MYRSLYTGSMPTQMPPRAYAEWKECLHESFPRLGAYVDASAGFFVGWSWTWYILVNDGKSGYATLPPPQKSTLLLRRLQNIRSTAQGAVAAMNCVSAVMLQPLRRICISSTYDPIWVMYQHKNSGRASRDFSLEQVGIDISAPCTHESSSLDVNTAKNARSSRKVEEDKVTWCSVLSSCNAQTQK